MTNSPRPKTQPPEQRLARFLGWFSVENLTARLTSAGERRGRDSYRSRTA